jgi:hypothetical protein
MCARREPCLAGAGAPEKRLSDPVEAVGGSTEVENVVLTGGGASKRVTVRRRRARGTRGARGSAAGRRASAIFSS